MKSVKTIKNGVEIDENGTIIRISQQAIDSAPHFTYLLEDAVAIGPRACAGLDFTKFYRNKGDHVIIRSHKGENSYHPTVDVPADLYFPSTIKKIGDGAFEGAKVAPKENDEVVIACGTRYFTKYGSSVSDGCTEFGDRAFADIKGLKMVCIAPSPQELKFGKDVFAGNGFVNEFNHYTKTFGGSLNGLYGFSAYENIEEKITSLNASLKVKNIPEHLSGTKVEDQSKSTGLADLINDNEIERQPE